jgi:nitrite reductase/ring-hydroxylating ferredoxin subunit
MHSANGDRRIPPPLEVVPDQWYAVLEANKVGKEPVKVRRFGEDLVLYRAASGAPACMIDRCPHRGVALSLGRVVGEELECGYHAFRFRADGACTAMPCEGRGAKIPNAMRAQAFPVREENGLIWVWWGAPLESLPRVPWLDDAPRDTSASYDTSYEWPVPTFQAIESAFDYHHAPVLHGKRSLRFTPIPRLRRASDVACEAGEDRIELRLEMREEDGPAPPSGRALRCHTSFRMPGLSLLRIGSFGRVMTIDTPIDAATTWRFARQISPFGRAFGLGKLYAWLSSEVDMRFGTQFIEDLPMVVTQAYPGDSFSDIYVKADAGCANYNKMRKRLLREARARAEEYPPIVRRRLGAGPV